MRLYLPLWQIHKMCLSTFTLALCNFSAGCCSQRPSNAGAQDAPACLVLSSLSTGCFRLRLLVPAYSITGQHLQQNIFLLRTLLSYRNKASDNNQPLILLTRT